MLNTYSRSLIIWELDIETWAQEMNGGPGTNWGPEDLNSSPPWKLYFNPSISLSFVARQLLSGVDCRYVNAVNNVRTYTILFSRQHCFGICIFHPSGAFHYFSVSSVADNCKNVMTFTDLNAFTLVFLLLRLQSEHYKQLLKLLIAVVDTELLETETSQERYTQT